MDNFLRTGVLIAALTALFMAVGYWVGGEQGMIAALLIAGVMNFVAYWTADRAILGLYGAHEVDDARAPGLMRLVRELASRAGLPMPRVYVIESDQPNALRPAAIPTMRRWPSPADCCRRSRGRSSPAFWHMNLPM